MPVVVTVNTPDQRTTGGDTNSSSSQNEFVHENCQPSSIFSSSSCGIFFCALVPQDDTMQSSATQHRPPTAAPLQFPFQAQGHIHRGYCNTEESSIGDQSFHSQPSWVVHLAHLIKQDTLQLLYIQTNRLQRPIALGSPISGSVHQ